MKSYVPASDPNTVEESSELYFESEIFPDLKSAVLWAHANYDGRHEIDYRIMDGVGSRVIIRKQP